MTGMEHAIEQAARLIDPDGWRLRDSGTLPLDHPGAQAVVRGSLETARALAAAGLLVPAPLRGRAIEQAARAEAERKARDEYWCGDTDVFAAGAEWAVARVVRADTVDRAQGDGRAERQ